MLEFQCDAKPSEMVSDHLDQPFVISTVWVSSEDYSIFGFLKHSKDVPKKYYCTEIDKIKRVLQSIPGNHFALGWFPGSYEDYERNGRKLLDILGAHNEIKQVRNKFRYDFDPSNVIELKSKLFASLLGYSQSLAAILFEITTDTSKFEKILGGKINHVKLKIDNLPGSPQINWNYLKTLIDVSMQIERKRYNNKDNIIREIQLINLDEKDTPQMKLADWLAFIGYHHFKYNSLDTKDKATELEAKANEFVNTFRKLNTIK